VNPTKDFGQDDEECVTQLVKKSFPDSRQSSYCRERTGPEPQESVELQQESAQIVALQVLAWLAADDELLPAFLNATGAGLGELRARAGDVDFQGAILDFLMMDDQWVVAFCDQHGLPYTAPQAARAALPGGEPVHWT
jgi:hypothetical protein